MLRVHSYATAEEARAAIETIDAARPPTEQATTVFGSRSTTAALAAGLVRRTRSGTLIVTGAGMAEGYRVESGRLVRHFSQPTRTWASVREVEEPDGRGGTRLRVEAGIALSDGTFAVPVCTEVAGVDVEVRGETKRVPDDTTARTITRDDVARPEVAMPVEPVDAKGVR